MRSRDRANHTRHTGLMVERAKSAAYSGRQILECLQSRDGIDVNRAIEIRTWYRLYARPRVGRRSDINSESFGLQEEIPIDASVSARAIIFLCFAFLKKSTSSFVPLRDRSGSWTRSTSSNWIASIPPCASVGNTSVLILEQSWPIFIATSLLPTRFLPNRWTTPKPKESL